MMCCLASRVETESYQFGKCILIGGFARYEDPIWHGSSCEFIGTRTISFHKSRIHRIWNPDEDIFTMYRYRKTIVQPKGCATHERSFDHIALFYKRLSDSLRKH